jgi:hypothetical protein
MNDNDWLMEQELENLDRRLGRGRAILLFVFYALLFVFVAGVALCAR